LIRLDSMSVASNYYNDKLSLNNINTCGAPGTSACGISYPIAIFADESNYLKFYNIKLGSADSNFPSYVWYDFYVLNNITGSIENLASWSGLKDNETIYLNKSVRGNTPAILVVSINKDSTGVIQSSGYKMFYIKFYREYTATVHLPKTSQSCVFRTHPAGSDFQCEDQSLTLNVEALDDDDSSHVPGSVSCNVYVGDTLIGTVDGNTGTPFSLSGANVFSKSTPVGDGTIKCNVHPTDSAYSDLIGITVPFSMRGWLPDENVTLDLPTTVTPGSQARFSVLSIRDDAGVLVSDYNVNWIVEKPCGESNANPINLACTDGICQIPSGFRSCINNVTAFIDVPGHRYAPKEVSRRIRVVNGTYISGVMYPDQQVVPPTGGSAGFVLEITNGGSHGKNVTLSWDSAKVSVKQDNVTLGSRFVFLCGAGLTYSFVVTYTVDSGTSEGTYPFHVNFVEGGANNSVGAGVKVTNEPIRKVSVSPGQYDLSIQLNRMKTIGFTISNIGTVDDSFKLVLSGSASPFMGLSAGSMDLKKGSSDTVGALFSAPEDGLFAGNYTYTLQVASTSDRDVNAKASGIITVTSPEFGVFPETANISIFKNEFRDVGLTFKSGLHARNVFVKLTSDCPTQWLSNTNWTNGTIDLSVNTYYSDYVRISPDANIGCILTFTMECEDGTDIKQISVYGMSTDDEIQGLNQTWQMLESVFANTSSQVNDMSTNYNTTFIKTDLLARARQYLDECNNQIIARNGDLASIACADAEVALNHAEHAFEQVIISTKKQAPFPLTIFTVIGFLLVAGGGFYLYKMFQEGAFSSKK